MDDERIDRAYERALKVLDEFALLGIKALMVVWVLVSLYRFLFSGDA